MSFFSWNTRGFNPPSKHTIVRKWVSSNSALETRVKEDSANRIVNSVFNGWSFINNYTHSHLGRIWFVWSDVVQVTPVYNSSQMITCAISIPSLNKEFFCSCIYAENTPQARSLLWSDIRDHFSSPLIKDKPWILLGDYNEICSSSDHYSGIQLSSSARDFQQLLADCSLTDLRYHGLQYTWSNKQRQNPVVKKLDRALINDDWLIMFPHSYARFDSGGCSDHARCLVLLSSPASTQRKPFKFVNALTMHEPFLTTIADYWQQTYRLFISTSAMFRYSKKLKQLKQIVRSFSRDHISILPARARDALIDLEEKQRIALSDPSELSFLAESAALVRWQFVAGLEESFYKQRSRDPLVA